MKPNCLFLLFMIIFSCCDGNLLSQGFEQRLAENGTTCSEMFAHAMNVLPKFYKEKSLDSLSKAIELWEGSCPDMPEAQITQILLDIEASAFSTQQVNASLLELLDNYVTSFPAGKKKNEAAHDQTKTSFYKFTIAWSSLLLRNKTLDNNQRFICKVLSGEIKYPQQEIQENPETYPELSTLLSKNYTVTRRGLRGNLAVSAGVWVPTKDLSLLGAHPSLGLHIGVRPGRHQVDLSLQFRFLNSPNFYTVVKDGLTYTTTYYFGGYIGADYTYYVLSTKKVDIGFLAGMGLDGFDFAKTEYNSNPDNSNATLFSFNANAGVRFNYYFTPGFYAGLQGRYNGVHYSSHGGTNLTGDAISIDLLFGFQGNATRR